LSPYCQPLLTTSAARHNATSDGSRVRSSELQLSPTSLTCARKHWRQLDDFHSLTDLKIHVSSHSEPQITAGLRSVCWKVHSLFFFLQYYKLISHRSSLFSKPSTARHGQPTSPIRANPTSRFAHITFVRSGIPTSSSRPLTH
jgi:hypothetical protein